jgi:serine/threonine protein phosphatase PrpC
VQYSHDECQLFVVADGVCGHSGGEQASTLAVASVEAFVLSTRGFDDAYATSCGINGVPATAALRNFAHAT